MFLSNIKKNKVITLTDSLLKNHIWVGENWFDFFKQLAGLRPLENESHSSEKNGPAALFGLSVLPALLEASRLRFSPLLLTPRTGNHPYHLSGGCCHHVLQFQLQVCRTYARERRSSSSYDLFGGKVPSSKVFRRTWAKQMTDDEDHLWTASEDDEDDKLNDQSRLKKDIKKAKDRAKHHSDKIDADDSDELWSVMSGSDDEKTLWTGSEGDDDDDIPTEAYPNEKSDTYIDKLFEFEEKPKYQTLAQAMKDEQEPEELSPGKQARKLAFENAMKKLKKGPDGRYINVWEVMSDIDVLISAFEDIISGPEYEELRREGPKRLNMEFFKDVQAKMRDPNYQFHPELKLKPKSKFVPRKKWQKAQSRRRKDQKR